ncbi:hypothetical protein BUALT_Bualt02G0099100 [Buddleja alternifolia]|uniref:Uncharacterized protein n=1 Tax=Buddleja alternifolia TaxID=168488 RepID=A0AAV6XZ21_9LAMI|nr:hypothetical protein BUALT_Bualt02G0099100 [Buddleja alternifolia]
MKCSRKQVGPNGEVLCYCGKQAILWTSWKEEDPSKRLYGCKVEGCPFELLKDSPMCYRSKMVIPELHNGVELLEVELLELMFMVEFLSEKVKKLQRREMMLQMRVQILLYWG